MTSVIPFRGIYYDPERVSADDVVCPPYDVITPEMKEAFYARSPFNSVRIDFGMDNEGDTEEENRYTRSSAFLKEWRAEGIMRRSDKPCYYAYRMDYTVLGKPLSLTGFFGLARLVDLGEGVYPHEATHSKPKHDRLSLLKITGANTSPIYSLYKSPEKGASNALAQATEKAPHMRAVDSDGTAHSFWPVEAPELVAAIEEDMKERDIFIADGHHRYETALEYQRLMRRKEEAGFEPRPYDYVLMFLANTEDEGVTALPTHRLVNPDPQEDLIAKLRTGFQCEELPADTDITGDIAGNRMNFGLYYKKKYYRLKYTGGGLSGVHPAMKDIDVVILHEAVFDNMLRLGSWGYEMDPGLCASMVDKGQYGAAFFLNPTPVEDVIKVSLASVRMPPKSTYFYPKLQTGFVINSLKSF